MCKRRVMRLLVCFLLLLAIAAPSAVWAGQADMDQSLFARTQSSRPAASPQAAAKPSSPRSVAADPATLCETAVTTAEYVNRLPPRLLGAISLTETGRVDPATGRLRPWPWTINAEGAGQFFETRQEAIAAVKALQARGVRSIDVGCLQVNLMFHPDAFASLDDAFDPRANAPYAAGFLNSLYAAGRDWSRAIAAYHSETPALGDAYRVLVEARWQNPDPHATTPSHAAYRDFANVNQVYGAFAPSTRVYGAFAPH
ncbi:MAG: transglycosylase SLT domain-containing protein [Rhodopila sp.]|nr:transglycosylase SLT domain-containing protein [Rhodopila sp.]